MVCLQPTINSVTVTPNPPIAGKPMLCKASVTFESGTIDRVTYLAVWNSTQNIMYFNEPISGTSRTISLPLDSVGDEIHVMYDVAQQCSDGEWSSLANKIIAVFPKGDTMKYLVYAGVIVGAAAVGYAIARR